MRSIFKLLFYINKQKVKANGETAIMGRITIDGKVAQYSTGITISPNDWNAIKGRAKSDKEINRSLDELEANAKITYKRCVDRDGFVTAEIIKNAVTGRVQVKDTLLTLFDDISFATQNPDKIFLVTEIGCSIAGYTPAQIALLFAEAIEVENIHLPRLFWELINYK